MNSSPTITAAELAAFMNVGWPGADWYLEPDCESVWEELSRITNRESSTTLAPAKELVSQEFLDSATVVDAGTDVPASSHA